MNLQMNLFLHMKVQLKVQLKVHVRVHEGWAPSSRPHVQDCEESILLEPSLVKPHLRKATALRSLGRVQEALEEYTRVLELRDAQGDDKLGLLG